MTKKEIKARRAFLTRNIRNIRLDYAGVFADEVPEEVTAEIKEMLAELMELREADEVAQ